MPSPRFLPKSVFCTQFVVRSPRFAVGSRQSAVRSPQSAVRSPQAAVRSPQSAVRSPQSTVYNLQLAVRSPCFILIMPVSSVCKTTSCYYHNEVNFSPNTMLNGFGGTATGHFHLGKTEDMLVYQSNPAGVELYVFVKPSPVFVLLTFLLLFSVQDTHTFPLKCFLNISVLWTG